MLLVIKNIAFFYNEIAKFIILGELFFNFKLNSRRYAYLIWAIGSLVFGGIAYILDDTTVSILNVGLLVIFMKLLTERLKIRYIILEVMVITLADCIIVFMVMYLGGVTTEQIVQNPIINFLTNCILTVLLFITMIIKRIRGYRGFRLNFDFKITCVLITSALISVMVVAYAEEYGLSIGSTASGRLGVVFFIVLIGLFFLVQCIGVFFYVQNVRLKNDVRQKEEFAKKQKHYHDDLLDKEEQTKRFRHDIRGHVNSLKALIEEEDYESLKEYLNSVEGYMTKMKLDFTTGNHIINAIVADIKSQYPNVNINWKGKIPSDLKVQDMDLCIIFSNLIKNACREVNDSEKNTVDVEVKLFNTSMFIIVKNVIVKSVQIQNNHRIIKRFEEGHGFGLRNVEDVVLEYNGTFYISNENNIFSVDIMLPDIL